MANDPFPHLARPMPHVPAAAASPWRLGSEAGPAAWRNVAKWAVAFLFLLVLAATLTTLMLFQATSEGASKRTLRRAVAALSEIDPLIDRNWDSLHQQAMAAGMRSSDPPRTSCVTRSSADQQTLCTAMAPDPFERRPAAGAASACSPWAA